MAPRARRNGFTVIELMVVVVIASIMALIGTSVYQDAMNYTRQKEAKVSLAAMYAVEVSLFAEWTTFSYCLRQLGFQHDSFGITPVNREYYYAVGFFAASIANDCGPQGNKSCLTWDFVDRPAGWATPQTCRTNAPPDNDATWIPTSGNYPPFPVNGEYWEVTRFTFKVGASGFLQNGNPPDAWTMDQNKNLTHVLNGL